MSCIICSFFGRNVSHRTFAKVFESCLSNLATALPISWRRWRWVSVWGFTERSVYLSAVKKTLPDLTAQEWRRVDTCSLWQVIILLTRGPLQRSASINVLPLVNLNCWVNCSLWYLIPDFNAFLGVVNFHLQVDIIYACLVFAINI